MRETWTGFELWQRKGMERIRDLIRTRQIDVLVVYDPDRLSRNQAHVAIIFEEAQQHGVLIRFVTVDAFDDTPIGRHIRSSLAFAAELEREKTKERTWRGIVAQAESGRRMPGCKPRFGYRWEDVELPGGKVWTKARLVADPLTAPVVQRIFSLAVDGVPTRRIAATLSAEGVPTPKGGDRWSQASARNVLGEPMYTGRADAFRYRTEKVVGEKRDGSHGQIVRVLKRSDGDEGLKRTDLSEGTVEPLVDLLTFRAIEGRMAQNREESIRNTHPEHREDALLRSSFAKCGYCGKNLVVSRSRGVGRYTCQHTAPRGGTCPSFSVSTTILDQMVWRRVKVALADEDAFVSEIEAQLRGPAAEADLAGIDATLERIKRERAFAVRQVDRIGRDTVDPEEADEAAAPYNAKLVALAKQERETKRERESRVEMRSKDRELDAYLGMVRRQLGKAVALTEGLDYDGKRKLLSVLGVGVRVFRTDHDPRIETTARVDLEKWSWLDDADPITGPDHEPRFLVDERLPGGGLRTASSTPSSTASAPTRPPTRRSSARGARPRTGWASTSRPTAAGWSRPPSKAGQRARSSCAT